MELNYSNSLQFYPKIDVFVIAIEIKVDYNSVSSNNYNQP